MQRPSEARMLGQRSEGSKLRRSNYWMHCLTYLDYSNSNQQRKSHAKLDAKNTNGRQAGRQARTASADTVLYCTPSRTPQQRPTNTLSTTSAARSAFHQLPSKTARSVSGQCKSSNTVGPMMRQTISCLVLLNVTPQVYDFCTSKTLYTNSNLLDYTKCGGITLWSGARGGITL